MRQAVLRIPHRRYFSSGGAALPRRLPLREQFGGARGGLTIDHFFLSSEEK
jgi:hypothetical protein